MQKSLCRRTTSKSWVSSPANPAHVASLVACCSWEFKRRRGHGRESQPIQKRPDVHKIVLSIKSHSPPGKSVNFEDSPLICTVFPHFGHFWGGGGGGVKPNFADKNFMDTQTFLAMSRFGFALVLKGIGHYSTTVVQLNFEAD